MSTQNEINPADLIDVWLVPQDPEYQHLGYTDPQWKWAVRNRHKTGLDEAIIKFGKRMFLHRPRFRRVLAKQAERH